MPRRQTPRAAYEIADTLARAMSDKRIEVLRAVGQFGSISQAARASGISYKAAWQAIETLSNLAGAALVEKSVGGSGGGGARLTRAAKDVLHASDCFAQAREQALAQLRQESPSRRNDLSTIAAMSLQTSMRNQLPCTVCAIEVVSGMAHITLELADGQRLRSSIMHESLELLELKSGMRVLALFKATAVTIAPTIMAMGQINVITGDVVKRSRTKGDRQLSLAIAPGLFIAGLAQPEALLKSKQPAMAGFAESAVVIGLAR